MRLWLLAALLLTGQAACNNAGFSGSSADAKKAEKTEDVAEGDPDPDDLGETGDPEDEPDDEKSYDVPDDCTSAGVTQAKLLTESVKNDAVGEWIEYQIFVTDCEGKVRNVSSDSILFDVNATTDGAKVPIQFQVQTPKRKLVASGVMNIVTGKDLFGVETPTRFHYRTDKRIEFSLPSKSFVFRVSPGSGRETAVENDGNPVAMAGDQQIETYLRFGEAKPVSKVVLFVNP